jgi:predicted MPP superfamily phosphohydrolase
MKEKILNPAYDARKPFSEFLIDLIEKIINSSQENNLDNWERNLRDHISVTRNYISETNREKINSLLTKYNNLKNPIGSAKLVSNNMFTLKASSYLFMIQEIVFTSTNQLLVPSMVVENDKNEEVTLR